jgi:signal transduction histidine kinase
MDARFEGREEYRRYLALLREQARRLNQLMREVLEYGKPSRPELVNGSITGVLEEALAASRPVAERAGVRLTGRLADEPACFELDRSRLLRVFTNLLENAIQHTPAGSAVTLESRTCEEDGERCIQCAVADGGPGIAAEDLPHIFQPFYTRRPGGTGLGLSIVQRIVQEHGGRLTAANRVDGGAVMTVRLPVGVRKPAVAAGRDVEA